jgi:lipopolysaccharide heptosyltransferase II
VKVSAAHWIDIHVGWFICLLLHVFHKLKMVFRKAPAERPAHPSSVLIIKFWGMGSVILTIPALRLLKKMIPGVKVTFVTLKQNSQICQLIEEIDHIETIDISKGLRVFFWETLVVLRKLGRMRFDEAIDLEFFTKFSAIFTYFVRARVKIGFFDRISWRGRLYDIEIPFNSYWHATENFTNAVIGLETKLDRVPQPRLNLSAQDQGEAQALLSRIGIDRKKERVIVVNPNAGELVLLRRWPRESFVDLTRRLWEDPRLKFLFIGSPKERAFVQGILDDVASHIDKRGGRIFNLAGELSVRSLAGLLAASDLLISNDSGPLHLAFALGVPTVSFFGPETPILYGPLGEGDRVFFKNLPCSPCINVYNNKRPVCRHKRNICLSGISVEEVAQEVSKLFTQ